MGHGQRRNDMRIVELSKGAENTVARAFNSTAGQCTQCGCPEQAMLFCGGSGVTGVRGCDLDGEHIHRLCKSCKYPWVERTLAQRIEMEGQGEHEANSELSEALVAAVVKSGGIRIAAETLHQYRGWVLSFRREEDSSFVVIEAREPAPQKGEIVQMTVEKYAELNQ